MYLVFLLSGIVFIPQAHSLKCNSSICDTVDPACQTKEKQCGPGYTRCGATRNLSYNVNNTVDSDVLFRSCIKPDTCEDASYNAVVFQRFYTIMCCDTDLCNSDLVPPLPTRKPAPNGSKCYQCGGNPNCNATMDCTGDETFCFTEDSKQALFPAAYRALHSKRAEEHTNQRETYTRGVPPRAFVSILLHSWKIIRRGRSAVRETFATEAAAAAAAARPAFCS